jgi:predicted metal-binding membrane protein
MMESAFEAMLRRDRMIVAGALILLIALAWGYVLWLVDAMSMGGMEMPGMRMVANPLGAVMISALQPWSATEFALMFLMWTIMMVGMMVPSAAPTILIYARVGRQAERKGKPLAGTGYFAAGYLLAWTAFSLIATTSQWMLERASLVTPTMVSASTIVGGIVLVAAGVFQWMPLKDTCLNHCQAPLMFIQRHGGFRREPLGSLRIGFHHGLYCVGCCWALMALLFVGGIMNVVWIAGIAIFVLAEKVIPLGNILSRLAGVALIAAGVWLIGTSIL